MNFSAVILAGGRSLRMGRDKAALRLQGKSLLTRQVELARELGAAEVFISGRAGVDYIEPGCVVLKDAFEEAGPLAGIESALTATSTPLLLVLAVDMPNLRVAPLRVLIAQCMEDRGGISRVNNRVEPLAAVYPRTALKLVRELLENGRCAATHFAERCVELKLASYVDFPATEASYFENWNTPADVPGAVD
jgi:molybdopterin-guanine dinucleotide biosynthesis protein A